MALTLHPPPDPCRAPASKRHQAFKSAAQRPVVRVCAAAEEEATSSRSPKKPLSELQVGGEYEGRVVSDADRVMRS